MDNLSYLTNPLLKRDLLNLLSKRFIAVVRIRIRWFFDLPDPVPFWPDPDTTPSYLFIEKKSIYSLKIEKYFGYPINFVV